MRRRKVGWALVVFLVVAMGTGCGGSVGSIADDESTVPDPPEDPPAPWSDIRLSVAEVPGVYVEAWEAAENRGSCALIAPDSLGAGAEATPRRATFGGGWGVAYDLPDLRSAFGVAGTGVEPGSDTYDEWPHERCWSDGSVAEYGPEGGAGPNQLAYLRIDGQSCLYNVWSRLGLEHLEFLLHRLRLVAV